MILTVTANPLLDRMLEIDAPAWGRVHRAEQVYELAGGKGVNASRAVARLGYRTTATGFLGGYTGRRILELLAREAIPSDFVEIASQTRSGVTLKNTRVLLTAFYDPPHQLRLGDLGRFIDKFMILLQRARFCIIAGSMPGAEFSDFYRDLIQRSRHAGVPVLLDTYGDPLRLGAAAAPDVVKINRHEAAAAFGFRADDETELLQWMDAQHQLGSRLVVVTHGGEPGWARHSSGFYRIAPPSIRLVNALGCGDCVAAGIAVGWSEGWPLEHLLAFAFAAGSANAEIWDPAMIERSRVQELTRAVRIEPRSP